MKKGAKALNTREGQGMPQQQATKSPDGRLLSKVQ
jgi:hypothetical protein